MVQFVEQRQLHQLLNKAVATHPLKRHLGTRTTPLIYLKYHQTYLNTSGSNRTHKNTNKKRKNRKKGKTRNKKEYLTEG